MHLRNGKQVASKQVASKQTPLSFVDTIKHLLDEVVQSFSPIDKLNAMRNVFQAINKQSYQTLSEMGANDDYKFISTIYRKTVELTCVIVDRSYANAYCYTDKVATIRLLSEMFQARQTAAQIIWDGRTSKDVQYMMEKCDRHSELLYRCIKHAISDEAESRDYEIHLYEDGEYTDEELYDWYLLPNYGEVASTDSYTKNADACFGSEIRRFNATLWH